MLLTESVWLGTASICSQSSESGKSYSCMKEPQANLTTNTVSCFCVLHANATTTLFKQIELQQHNLASFLLKLAGISITQELMRLIC